MVLQCSNSRGIIQTMDTWLKDYNTGKVYFYNYDKSMWSEENEQLLNLNNKKLTLLQIIYK